MRITRAYARMRITCLRWDVCKVYAHCYADITSLQWDICNVWDCFVEARRATKAAIANKRVCGVVQTGGMVLTGGAGDDLRGDQGTAKF